jgi:hypothetical protein
MRPKPGYSLMAFAAATVLVAALFSGCSEKKIGAPDAYSGPTLCSDSLGLGRVACPSTGYVILEQEKSHGRFPCRVAVARLVPAPKDPFADPLPTEWALGSIPDEEGTYWTSLFNTLTDVQGVALMDPLNMEHPEANLEKIAATAGNMKNGLCVIFGPGPASANSACVLGVIMDAARRKRIACVQALAGPKDYYEARPDQMIGDQRNEDVNYIAMRRFQQQVRQCMEQLRTSDIPAPATQPSPWRGTTRPIDRQLPPIYIIPNRSSNW